jgi:hypothetical protein
LLTELLTEIGGADLQINSPGGLEERVLRHWDRDAAARAGRIRRRPRTPGWLVSCAGALAAAMLLLVLVHRSSQGPIVAGAPVTDPEVRAQPKAVEVPAAAAVPPAVGPRPITVARVEAEKRPRRVESPSEIVSFVPLFPEARQDLLGSFQVARVLLPREVLADLGVVPDASRVGGPIQADVVFGEDGLARAIRLADRDPGRAQ